ncbi:hypothetical protein H072_8876 [Dactylellina haptotyla CBS 200.50]|uniref:Rad4 beta-hairpin domain-containing protein n=1 Tax=Dactylellina haptotyla (strain CBS 200.50) TaxID=1284197 RepID=S8BDW5_DACHA|nr:hypothetical protein H072_8876 [Dactylellina haptotyla CBS 200.50]
MTKAQSNYDQGKRSRAITSPAEHPNVLAEEHIRKRRRVERGFRKAVGQAVSDHESDEESDSNNSTPDSDSAEDSQYEIEDNSSDDAGDWEDILETADPCKNLDPTLCPSDSAGEGAGDLILTLDKEPVQQEQLLKKKGASARERQERLSIHVIHVICLMYHGFLRNIWINDKELQRNLLKLVEGTGVKKGIDLYISSANFGEPDPKDQSKKKKTKGKSNGKKRQKPKEKTAGLQLKSELPGSAASNSDPRLVELLGILMRFWGKKFRVTAPGLRKKGYTEFPSEALAIDENSSTEQTSGIEEFRRRAIDLHGSRDSGAQLFTALLRALGLESRLVFSLCPLGYGFTKVEMRDQEEIDGQNNYVTDSNSSTEDSCSEIDAHSDEVSLPPKKGDHFASKSNPKGKKPRKSRLYDKDLKFPTFWTEVYSPVTQKWIAVDPFATGMVLSNDEDMCKLEPKGQAATHSKQQISYVVAYNTDKTARDVTVRYLSRRAFPGKTRGFRMPPFERELLSGQGDVFAIEKYDMFSERILKCFQLNGPGSPRDRKEEQELLPVLPAALKEDGSKESFPTSIAAYKNHPKYVLERHMLREDCVLPGELPIHILFVGKSGAAKEEIVYSRESIVVGKPSENWYKEGRVTRLNEQPLKYVPSRAVTVNRKRDIENARREGEMDAGMVGLYAFYQTELYRPPPISNGVIPKNSYGNIDCFVPSMIPRGASHVPFRNAARVCKKMGIEYAEAVTGFEFKNKRAIPRTEGVICSKENADVLTEACRQDGEQRILKEEGKREQICLALWGKFLIGLRIVERVEEEYGSIASEPTEIGRSTREMNTEFKTGEAMNIGEQGTGGFFLE